MDDLKVGSHKEKNKYNAETLSAQRFAEKKAGLKGQRYIEEVSEKTEEKGGER